MMWRTGRPPKPSTGTAEDTRLVRRATLTIAVLTAIAVAVVVTAVALLAMLLTVREQRVDAERIVNDAATFAEDVTDPPPGVILLLHASGAGTEASAGAPPAVAALDVGRLAPGPSQVTLGRHEYQLFTSDHGGKRVIAALDLRYRARESEQLLGSLLPASVVGIAAAAVIGWLVARRAVQPLGAALALQRRFVADASHELRTPLTILHTRAQLLRRRAGTDPMLGGGLDRLIDDTRALTEIVNDLLLSAEMEHRPAAREPVDLTGLAHAVTESFAHTAERADVSLTAVVHGDGDTTVAGVPAALRRAISALVDNALGHNHPGGTITVTIARRDRNVELAVVDDGEGLDPSQASELTKRFARGPDAPGHGRRFGLGLALVREVVHAHGGTLSLDGRPGEGATATITIPGASRDLTPR
jgi:signal transduction histidine kinase